MLQKYGFGQIRALTKLLKPESIESLKRLTTKIVGEKAREMGVKGDGVAPDRLTVGRRRLEA